MEMPMEMGLGVVRRAEEREFASGPDGDVVKLGDEMVMNGRDAKRGR